MDWTFAGYIGRASGADPACPLTRGRLTVPIAARYPIERIREAVTLQATRHVRGKVVIVL